MLDRAIVAAVERYLTALTDAGLPIDRAVVFGSRARGDHDMWSDIDTAVISQRFDEERSRELVRMLWRVAGRTDSRIEPFPVGRQQWESDDGTPLIEIARREGIEVKLPR